MNPHQTSVIQECASLSIEGKISFGDVVRRLMEIGLERYHADYSRHESTYYMPDGESLVVPVRHPAQPIAQTFSATGVEAAVRQAQRGEIFYPEFLKQTFAAGCVGYFVQITGRQVIYFGRNGEQHIERFPSPPQENNRERSPRAKRNFRTFSGPAKWLESAAPFTNTS